MYGTAKSNQSEIRILKIRRDVKVERKYIKMTIDSKRDEKKSKIQILASSVSLVTALLVINSYVLFQFHFGAEMATLDEMNYMIPHSILNIYE